MFVIFRKTPHEGPAGVDLLWTRPLLLTFQGSAQKDCTLPPASSLGAADGVREGAVVVCGNATGLGINTGALRRLDSRYTLFPSLLMAVSQAATCSLSLWRGHVLSYPTICFYICPNQ